MDNLFTPEMLRELMFADARALDIQTAANIDAVVASALDNIVGYEYDDKNIGLDTMLYQTK